MNARARIAIGAAVVGAASVGSAGMAMAGTAYPETADSGHVTTHDAAASTSSWSGISDDGGDEGRTGLLGGIGEGVGGLLGGVWDAAGPVVDGLI